MKNVIPSGIPSGRGECRRVTGERCRRAVGGVALTAVNGTWGLPTFVCDFYIAMDVTCSTSSIFNLVAISIDRYIAVTQPIKYAKHKSQRRVWLTIALVWVISAAIGSPIVLGLNNTPERLPDLCLFYNSDFIIYSSLSSFYIPCIIMVFLYYNIFKALRTRARRAKAARRPNTASSAMKQGTVIENLAQTRRLAETALGGAGGPLPLPLPLPITGGGSGGGSGPGSIAQSSAFDDDKPTNTGSGSQEEEDEEDDEEEEEEEEERDGGLEHSLPFDEEEDDCDGCHVIPNDKSTEFILATVTAERRRRRQRQQQQSLAAAGVMVGSAALGGGVNGRRLRSPAASPTNPPIVSATAAAPVVACGIVVATTGVGGDDTVPVGGNHDSGYAASNVVDEEGGLPHAGGTPKDGDAAETGADGTRKNKRRRPLLGLHRHSDDERSKSKAKKNGVILEAKAQAVREPDGAKGAKKGLAGALAGGVLPSQGMGAAAAAASAAGVGLSAAVASKKERKSGSRFTIYKVHKASRKKREKSSAKKERKATKTLAIVLGVFLFCWVPFFTCNIMDAICTKIGSDCQPGVTAFILTTWLGYMNSFVNPVIYTIFNPEFRKAFKKLMSVGT
ncbi:dopamine D2-like receptor [Hetaerina americana]|uniref:dopamine D2-like receptor n=1 Tax=Hetaerina americana TaxID=62018 RepID=UPI003A7F4696